MNVDDRLARMLEAEQRVRLLVERHGLKGGGGGGTSDSVGNEWKTSVEAQLKQLHADVRMLLIGLIAGFLVLLAGGATAYVKLSDQATASAVRAAEVTGKLDMIGVKLDALASRERPAH